MAGGILNIISHGASSVILTGNPDVTLFKHKYKKHTNFGLQRFRIDYKGLRRLQTSTESIMEFTIPRYADLVWDTYLVLTLPDIYSSVYYHPDRTNSQNQSGSFVPYEFRWVNELGTTMIKEVEVTCGSVTLARYSGEYLSILNSKDHSEPRQHLWNQMTGNIAELNNPAYANGRIGIYPTAVYLEDDQGLYQQPEPSIRRKQLMIPLEPWFSGSSHTAFPLVAVQNNELKIRVRFRPVDELFRIRNVVDLDVSFNDRFAYCSPDQNRREFLIQRFLYPPTDVSANEYNGISVDSEEFSKMPDSWNADIHLMATYVFLSDEERKWFAQTEHKYLIRDVFEYEIQHVQGTRQIEIDARDSVSHFMWRFRRSDAFLRNEWSNYTNWKYQDALPYTPLLINTQATTPYYTDVSYQEFLVHTYQNKGMWNVSNTSIQTQQIHSQQTNAVAGIGNQKEIMLNMGILMDGKYRENVFPRNVYQYAEPYARGNDVGGNVKDGVYLYSFATSMDRHARHPSGAMDLNGIQKLYFEINTINPPPNLNAPYENICEVDEDGNSIIIGVRKRIWQQYAYSYDLKVFEERYNILRILSGNAGLLFAR